MSSYRTNGCFERFRAASDALELFGCVVDGCSNQKEKKVRKCKSAQRGCVASTHRAFAYLRRILEHSRSARRWLLLNLKSAPIPLIKFE